MPGEAVIWFGLGVWVTLLVWREVDARDRARRAKLAARESVSS